MTPEEPRTISSSQLMFLIAGFIMGSVLLLSFIDNMLKQDTWLAVLAAYAACAPFILAITLLAKRFAGYGLMEILNVVYGRIPGTALFLLYSINFFILMAFNLRIIADFYVGFVMPGMPIQILMVAIVLVSAFAVKKGLRPIAKMSFFVVIYVAINILIENILLITKMDFTNMLPIFDAKPGVFIQGTHILAGIPFGEVYVFLMALPYIRERNKSVRTVFGGAAIGMLMLLTVTVRNAVVLGPSTQIYAGNTYETLRMINVGEFLTRVELFAAIGITLLIFTKISFLYYATVTSLAQMLRLKTQALILPLGGLAVILALIAFESTVEHNYYAARNHAYFSLLYAFILPPLTLLIAALRKLPRNTGVK